MRTNLILITLTLAAIFAITILIDHIRTPEVNEAPVEQSDLNDAAQAPDFAFTTIDGRDMRLSDLRGQPVILHFWATWCPPCIVEIPSLFKMAAQFDGKITILTLSQDLQEDKLRAFLRKENASSKNLLHVWDRKKDISHDMFQAYKLPETVIIDAKGRMLRKIPGGADWQSAEMIAYLNSLTDRNLEKAGK